MHSTLAYPWVYSNASLSGPYNSPSSGKNWKVMVIILLWSPEELFCFSWSWEQPARSPVASTALTHPSPQPVHTSRNLVAKLIQNSRIQSPKFWGCKGNQVGSLAIESEFLLATEKAHTRKINSKSWNVSWWTKITLVYLNLSWRSSFQGKKKSHSSVLLLQPHPAGRDHTSFPKVKVLRILPLRPAARIPKVKSKAFKEKSRLGDHPSSELSTAEDPYLEKMHLAANFSLFWEQVQL